MITYIAITLIILIKLDYIHIEFINPQKDVNEYIDNGLKLEDTSFDTSIGKLDRFYYEQLDDIAKEIYDPEHKFDEILKKEDGIQILTKEYQNAVDSVRYDNMDLFYIDFTKMALRTTTYTRGKNKTYEIYLSPMENKENYLEDYINSEHIDILLDKVETKKKQI